MENTSKKTTWTEIGNLSDLSDIEIGQMIALSVDEESGAKHTIALIRYADQEWYAIDNVCTHDNGSLDDGEINLAECSIECPRHGAQFNIKTGEVLMMPAVHPIRSYPLKIDAGILYIQL